MQKKLHERIHGALLARTEWEDRQRIWYAMRRDGLRRKSRESWQADLHLPIADNAIEKLKPYYLNGIFQRQQLASFTPLKRELAGANAQAAEMLDWKLKKESNYAEEMSYEIDLALLCGRGLLKIRWDFNRKRLAFDAIDPLFFIVPGHGPGRIDDMDWFCHVKQLTIGQYKRDPRYLRREEDFIERIRGGDKQHELAKQEEKDCREGITYSKSDEEIVLWEQYEKVEEGYLVRTESPTAPNEPVRKEFLLTTKWRGEVFQPFVSFTTEITDKGWYAPRGLPEKVMSFEAFGTKCWNAQADWLAFSSKPIFTQDPGAAAMTNTSNVKMKPGEVFPPGVKPATMPGSPPELEQQINLTRQLAEESAGSPDFGAQSAEQSGGSDKTATEWNYIGSFATQNIQHKAWITGLSEGEVYWRAWALLLQFGGREMTWIAAGELKVLPAQAMSDQYLIEPDLKPDSWDKTKRLQRAIARKQMFTGDVNIDQVELDRSVLEEDDPRLVKRLLIGQSVRAGEEMEDEAKEIVILEKGFPATVSPGEDHALRIRVLTGYMQLKTMRWQQGIEQPDPVAIQRLQEHLATHVQMLQQQNPKAAKQFIQAIGVVSEPQTISANGGSPDMGNGAAPAGLGAGGGLPELAERGVGA